MSRLVAEGRNARENGAFLMGAKAWFVAYYNSDPKEILSRNPGLDRDASLSFARQMLPGAVLEVQEDGDLVFLNPDKREVYVGVYGDLRIVAHADLGGDYPSRIDTRWYDPGLGSTAYVHATHSMVDWFAFGLWQKGELVRALSLSPDQGIQEDIGARLPFEVPFWDGTHKIEDEFDDELEDDEYPLPFHPLDLSETALLAMLGFQFEGRPEDWVCDPMEIPIMRFKVAKRAWWKVW